MNFTGFLASRNETSTRKFNDRTEYSIADAIIQALAEDKCISGEVPCGEGVIAVTRLYERDAKFRAHIDSVAVAMLVLFPNQEDDRLKTATEI